MPRKAVAQSVVLRLECTVVAVMVFPTEERAWEGIGPRWPYSC